MSDSTMTARLDASRLTTRLTSDPRPLPAPNAPEVRLLEYHTDHMLVASWNAHTGWSNPSIEPFGPIPLSPTASALHYATECFEGLKLFRGSDGRLRLFRSVDNCERMRRSAARVALPDFDARELEKLIVALCRQEAPKWLPREKGEGALYIRPTLLGTDPALATIRPRSALLVIVLAVFPNLMTGGPSGPSDERSAPPPPRTSIKLLASDNEQVRAWPGGFGSFKVGANYGPALVLQEQAKAQGFDQILWLLGDEGSITEAGVSNFFVVIRQRRREDADEVWQLVTAPLEEGIILPGIVRDSVLQLARKRLQGAVGDVARVEVEERRLTIGELVAAHERGDLIEAFVTGTALFIAPVGGIRSGGRDIEVNCEPVDGVLCSRLIRNWLRGITGGEERHDWATSIDE